MSEQEKQLPSSPEAKELVLEDYESLKTEALLKLGVSETALHAVSVERAFEEEESPDDPVFRLKYSEEGEAGRQALFQGETLFKKACLKIASVFTKEIRGWIEGVSNVDYYEHIRKMKWSSKNGHFY